MSGRAASWLVVAVASFLLMGACQSPPPAPKPSPTMSVERARGIAELYFDAYNAGDIERILPLLAEDVAFADCDYAVGARARVEGKSQVEAWLRARFAEHDRFEVERLAVNPETFGISVLYRSRTSDGLRARGVAADTTLAGSVMFFRGTEIVRLNTGGVEHCAQIVRR